MLGSSEGRLGVDDPIGFLQPLEKASERGGLRQSSQGALEAKLALLIGLEKQSTELAPEQATQHAVGQEEVVRRADPPRPVQGEAAARNDTVEMGVVMQVLAPGVEDTEEADAGPEMFRVGGNREQGLGSRTEKKVIKDPRILQGERSQFVRQCEDDVEVGDGEKLLGTIGEPFFP